MFRQSGAHHLLVEHVACDRHTARSQHLARPISQAHNGDIQRAAAKVEDQDRLRFILEAGIVVGRGDRFPLQVNALVAGLERAAQQPFLGQVVRLGVIGKAHGPSQHHFLQLPAE